MEGVAPAISSDGRGTRHERSNGTIDDPIANLARGGGRTDGAWIGCGCDGRRPIIFSIPHPEIQVCLVHFEF